MRSGFHGRKKMTQDEIEKAYGNPPVFSALDYPNVTRSFAEKDAYWVLMTYFDCCKAPLIAHAIELIDKGIITKSYHEFANDFLSSVLRQYAHNTAEKCFPICEYGEFFKEIVA